MATFIGDGGANVLTGTNKNDTLNGLGGDDVLGGSAGSDTLDGGSGNDQMVGGVGSDTYLYGVGYGNDVIDNSGGAANDLDSIRLLNLNAVDIRLYRYGNDLVLTVLGTGETLTVSQHFLSADFGIDRIQFADGSRWNGSTILANLYYPTVVPTEGADIINGNPIADVLLGLGGNDTLYGNGGNDSLDGGIGADRMEGGIGNDTYTVDDVGDLVIEASNAGDDTVQASINYILGIGTERLTLIGTADLNGTGNSLGNTLIGNSGNNLLDGGLGIDVLQGGDGNDILRGDSGTDTLQGGAGDDQLDGGANIDSMAGGRGDDIYLVSQAGDTVSEALDEGDDTVRATVNYSLSANLENLELIGTGNLSGTGNVLANRLTGNDGNNILNGADGNDWLAGRRGNDTYTYGLNTGNDRIDNSGGAAADVDTVQLSGLNAGDLRFVRSGNDLLMVVQATSQTLTLFNFYLAADYEIDRARFANGTVWNNATLKAAVSNTAPTSTDNSVTTLEDVAVMLDVNAFGSYSDLENSPLAAVRITALPAAGSLQYYDGSTWVEVIQDQVISRTDLDADRLRYIPDQDGNGEAYASIGFEVSDGTDFALNANILIINVTPVDDPVVATVTTLSDDSGSSTTDFITNIARQTVSGTYTGTLAAGATIQVSADGGTSWRTASADNSTHTWSASGIALVAGLGTSLQVQTIDAAGNVSTGVGHLYTLDSTADADNDLTLTVAESLINASEKSAVSYTVNGLDADASATATFTDGTNSVIGVDGIVDLSGLIDGAIRATVTATDTAGNSLSRTSYSAGGTTVFTFDDIASGNALTTQYLGLGVLASGASVLSFAPWPTHSGQNLIYSSTGLMSFSISSAVIGDIVHVSAYVSGEANTGLFAYDANGVLVGQALLPTDPSPNTLLSVTSSGNPIVRLDIHDGGATFGVDDLTLVEAHPFLTLDTSADIGNDLAVHISDPLIGDTEKTAVLYSVIGLDGDASATVTFSDGVNSVDGVEGTADLSSLADGPISVTVAAIDTAGNSASAALGGVQTLMLDELSDGDLADSYQHLGVTASGAQVTAAAMSIWPAHSGSKLAFAPSGLMVFDLAPAITGDVVTVSAYVSGEIDTGLFAYDADGNLVGQSVLPFAAPANTLLSVTSSGNPIVRVEILGNPTSFAIDDFSFSTAVSLILDTNADVGGDLAITVADDLINNAEINAVAYTVSGLDPDAGATVTFSDMANNQVTGIGGLADLSSLANGPISVTVTATDTAGNTASGADTSLTLDRLAPTVATEMRVTRTLESAQYPPTVTTLADGGWLVSWTEFDLTSTNIWDIYAQRYDAAGAAIGDAFRVNNTTVSRQSNSSVTALADGGWVVSWESLDPSGIPSTDIYTQRYDANGLALGAEFRVNSTLTADQLNPSITAIADGGWVVSWTSNDPGSNSYDVYAQRYDAGGAAIGSEFRSNSSTTFAQFNTSVTGLADGGWLVSWESYDPTSTNSHDIFAQRYGADGAKVGSEFRATSTIAGSQGQPSIAALADGSWIATWYSDQNGDTDIYARHYGVDGTAVGDEFRVNSTTAFNQFDPSVVALADGGWVVTWYSNKNGSGDVYAQHYGADATAIGGEVLVSSLAIHEQAFPATSALGDGGWLVTWAVASQNGIDTGIYARRYDAAGNPVTDHLEWYGDSGNNVFSSTSEVDWFIAGTGNDTFQFTQLPSTRADVVTDFANSEDLLALNNGVFNLQGQTPGDPGVLANVTGTQTEQVGAYLVFNQTSQTLYYDADATANGNAQALVTLAGVASLAASDVQMFA
ncbi:MULTISPECIES: S-layer family protein [unclassified Pseudomonas]|uniref:beta strand repeat-containing protein n=1 Tax=unclassified Pseudomonas TaxID=196821 RepID=UPI00129DA324|nr:MULTISPECIES: calcium-binding protein [unclassified Pseudomonas]MDH4651395.1 hypothetical protein [Pseudomonas sp. BN606]MRK23278.1 hypothetical protein [Pseudomonas sp. JG-B]